ncbi:hypothetical protein HNE05_18370 [Aquipseudomonas campi]|uniref:Uncharacterized protein n=1 Tax=Aquipseudomonas campi TaxID=2731681 RepID=A0A6M8FKR3_9GAMM|nr:hypothetical protein [Pseudomonas campi]QKE65237.1 hypothetical protein HNE05_18370 [Pseudomonas campi]
MDNRKEPHMFPRFLPRTRVGASLLSGAVTTHTTTLLVTTTADSYADLFVPLEQTPTIFIAAKTSVPSTRQSRETPCSAEK